MKMTKYMETKKVHKNSRYNSPIFGWVVRPECRVDNYTIAYKASTKWDDVTCEKCMKRNKKHEWKFNQEVESKV
jgi:hypothetical protein